MIILAVVTSIQVAVIVMQAVITIKCYILIFYFLIYKQFNSSQYFKETHNANDLNEVNFNLSLTVHVLQFQKKSVVKP